MATTSTPRRGLSTTAATKLDSDLLEKTPEELEKILDALGQEVGKLEVKKLELEAHDKNLEDDQKALTKAIDEGAFEREELQKSTAEAKVKAKQLKSSLIQTNKRRREEDKTRKKIETQLIDMKDRFEDMVWNRVDLEDMLRKLDRDLVIAKTKRQEVDSASQQTTIIEKKLDQLQKSISLKMKETIRMDEVREGYRSRLENLKIDLHRHSVERTNVAAKLEHQAKTLHRISLTKKSQSNDLFLEAFEKLEGLQNSISRSQTSRALFIQEVEISINEIRERIEQNTRERQNLQEFVENLVLQRKQLFGKIEKANIQLERYCDMMRRNKKWSTSDNSNVMQITSDLEASLKQIDEMRSLRVIGFDQSKLIDDIKHSINATICKRSQMISRVAGQFENVKRAQQLFYDLQQQNQYLSEQIKKLTLAKEKRN